MNSMIAHYYDQLKHRYGQNEVFFYNRDKHVA